MATRLTCAAETNVGLKRTNNEDYQKVVPERGLYVLCDGMGGHASGEVASEMCCTNVVKFVCEMSRQPGFEMPYQTAPNLSPEARLIVNAIKYANERVYIQSCKDRAMEGMGTTITCIYNAPHALILAHVGDSRIYRVRKGQITQMTRDHSLLNHLIDTGEVKPEDASHFANKNVILRAIGLKDYVDVEIKEVPREQGDVYMMCSDGLSDIVSESKILNAIENAPDLETACHELILLALQAGGKDNVTVVCVCVAQEDGAPAQSQPPRLLNAKPSAPKMQSVPPQLSASAKSSMGQSGMGQKGMQPVRPMQPGAPMQPGRPMQPGMMPQNMAQMQGMGQMQPGMMPQNMAQMQGMGQMRPGMMPQNMAQMQGMGQMQPGMMPQNMAQMQNMGRMMGGGYGAMAPMPGMVPMPGRMVPQPPGMPVMPGQPKPQRMHSVREVVDRQPVAAPRPMPKPIGAGVRSSSTSSMPALAPAKPAVTEPAEAVVPARSDTSVEKPVVPAPLHDKSQLTEEEKAQRPDVDLLFTAPPVMAEDESSEVSEEHTMVECPIVTEPMLGTYDAEQAHNHPSTPMPAAAPSSSENNSRVHPSSGSNARVDSSNRVGVPSAPPSLDSSNRVGVPSAPPSIAAATNGLGAQLTASVLGVPADEFEDDDDDEPTTVRKFNGFPLEFAAPAEPENAPQTADDAELRTSTGSVIEELAESEEPAAGQGNVSASVRHVNRGYVAPANVITPPKDDFDDDDDSIEIGGSGLDGEEDETRQLRRPDFTRNW